MTMLFLMSVAEAKPLHELLTKVAAHSGWPQGLDLPAEPEARKAACRKVATVLGDFLGANQDPVLQTKDEVNEIWLLLYNYLGTGCDYSGGSNGKWTEYCRNLEMTGAVDETCRLLSAVEGRASVALGHH